jgi:hypothetical protein
VQGGSFTSTVYLGTTKYRKTQHKVKWDQIWNSLSKERRINATKNTWLAKFHTLDNSSDNKRKREGSATTPNKKPRSGDAIFDAFMNGEALPAKSLESIGRQL